MKLLGRFERLPVDFAKITDQLGIPRVELPRLNAGPRPQRDYRAHFTSETRALVAELFREDIETFGYEF